MTATRGFEKVINYVLELIQNGNLKIGSELPSERQLTNILELSRNSVREGLRSLEDMGIIKSLHGSGNYISGSISENMQRSFEAMILLRSISMKEIISFRKSIELSVYELAFENKNKTVYIEKLSVILKDFLSQPLEEQIKRDTKFHRLLVSMAENQILDIVMGSISKVYLDWVRDVLSDMDNLGMQHLHEAHLRIYKSLAEENKVEGIRAIEEHYSIIEKNVW